MSFMRCRSSFCPSTSRTTSFLYCSSFGFGGAGTGFCAGVCPWPELVEGWPELVEGCCAVNDTVATNANNAAATRDEGMGRIVAGMMEGNGDFRAARGAAARPLDDALRLGQSALLSAPSRADRTLLRRRRS